MLSLKYIRENKDFVQKSLDAKKNNTDLKQLLDIDIKRRKIISQVEELKAKRNIVNKDISKKIDFKENIEKMRLLSSDIKSFDKELKDLEESINDVLLHIPNTIHESVPIGKSEKDNVVVKEWGEKPSFDFEPKSHIDICNDLKLVDFKRGAKISGSGFPLYTNIGAKLERALINYMLDIHTTENDYTELLPPFLVNSKSPQTTGNLPKFKEDMYYIENDDLYCIPTAEVPVTNLYSNEVIDEDELPIKYCAFSSCFRREAGSYGKDTKGLLRLHQFNKVELVKFVKPEESYNELESLLQDAEKILQNLNLHYRIITLCSADLSFSAAKCYDIEVWSPFENKYLEVSSCSNFESFQARRGNIKFKKKIDSKLNHVHTINGSGLATPRLMISLLESYQCKDGSVDIPHSLINYINTAKIK